MKRIPAGQFKNQCLRIMDQVAESKDPVVVTKRGRPVVRIVPYKDPPTAVKSLAGSVLKEKGSPFRTGEKWHADLP